MQNVIVKKRKVYNYHLALENLLVDFRIIWTQFDKNTFSKIETE